MDSKTLLVRKKLLVFDIEANGLLQDSTEVYCIIVKNIISGEYFSLERGSIYKKDIFSIFNNSTIIGHNIIDYDIPMIEKFYDISLLSLLGKENILDTYLWSRVLHPDRQLPKGCPTSVKIENQSRSRIIGPHSLEAWGYRIGNKKIEIHDWMVFSDDIISRCKTDVDITEKVFFQLLKEANLSLEYLNEYF